MIRTVKKNIIQTVFIVMSFLFVSKVFAESLQCQNLFKPLSRRLVYRDIIPEFPDQPIQLVHRDWYKGITTAEIFPTHNPETTVYVGFHNAHTYLIYKGVKIDSAGVAGITVKPSFSQDTAVDGHFIIAIKNLSSEALMRLDEKIKNQDLR